ncbi:MAG TPA: 2-phosphosulfolactate phosphatase [Ktedonobacterales bacterium]|nr:2-phosphosulfolactate phosphatase [Ktedonobacterales bacterium]
MEIQRVYRTDAAQARGIVLVIDVFRAFSVAAYAFAGGVQQLWLVRAVEDALALREREPKARLAGEVGGRLIPGFDFNNSPARMAAADVQGRLLIQCTGAGTQGAVGAVNASHLLLCSLVNARATAAYARELAATTDGLITLMPTEPIGATGITTTEDDICADYLEALLTERADAEQARDNGIAWLRTSGRLAIFEQGIPDFPFEDIAAALAVDRFHFAMVGTREHWNQIAYIRCNAEIYLKH